MGAATWSRIIRDPADEAMALMCGNGVIAERTDAPYRGGHSRDWLTITSRRQTTFRVLGWPVKGTDPSR